MERGRPKINWIWLPSVSLGLLRAWLSYGPAGAIGLAVAMTPMVVVLLRWGRDGVNPNGWRLCSVIFSFSAVAAFLQAPFAHTSNVGTDVANSRSTTLQAAVALVVMAFVCWLVSTFLERKHTA